jgi:hypothetical protein
MRAGVLGAGALDGEVMTNHVMVVALAGAAIL